MSDEGTAHERIFNEGYEAGKRHASSSVQITSVMDEDPKGHIRRLNELIVELIVSNAAMSRALHVANETIKTFKAK